MSYLFNKFTNCCKNLLSIIDIRKNAMKNLLLILLFIYTNLVFGQIKIGDNPEILDTNSLLELESDSKVLVISRMSEAQMLALTPLQGAMVYNTEASCIFYFDGSNWNNLCEGGSTSAISWGNIAGTITDQADLVTELQNYVDLTTAQSIAGEKTLTEKFTVNTGDTSAQVAEFLGRVKGENAVDPEDFITKFQLDTLSTTGSATTTWADITGNIADNTNLTTELANYVDLTTVQNIAGEKTLTEKFTVNTGDTSAQVAEFLGRVKGENAVDPEDFITKFQLDTLSTTGSSTTTWADITGNIADNTALTTELTNYVDLTTAQNIAGEKTLTEKFTVNTGDTSAQIAEFLGRVKGENGTEDEDFVTIQQLNAVSAGALTGTPGSIFFAGETTQPTHDETNLNWNSTNKQLRVGDNIDRIQINTSFSDDTTTLNIQGSVSKPLDNATTLTEEHHTIIINWPAGLITLPNPNTCYGRIYIIKISGGADVPVNFVYYNSLSQPTNAFPNGEVTQIQSSGIRWEQIN